MTPRDGTPWYTQNLSPDSTEPAMLQEVFASCGHVRNAVVVKGQGGQSTGAAYIYFEDHTSAKVGGLISMLSGNWLTAHSMLRHKVSSAAGWGPPICM